MLEVVTAVRVLRPYVLDVRFADGVRGLVDVEPELRGELLEPLRAPDLFSQASLDPVLGTVVWPNGADLSPEYLYEQAKHRQSAGSIPG
jgi:hypothetical protein